MTSKSEAIWEENMLQGNILQVDTVIVYQGIFLEEPLASVSTALDDTGRNLSCH